MTDVIIDAASGEEARSRSAADSSLQGKRVAMIMFSRYPADPRPRRAVDAFIKGGMTVDLICLVDEKGRKKIENRGPLSIRRVSIKHERGRKFSYAYNYLAFIVICGAILAVRSFRRRYDLVYVHNMPDILVISALIPKALGAKVILDQHDPMPELMMTIFALDRDSASVRLLSWLEKRSFAIADFVITVNIACKRLFESRSCVPGKIGVVMNSPDGEIFPFRVAHSHPCPERVPEKPFVMMYHGSLVQRNGLEFAVDALALASAAIPNSELRIFGRESAFLSYVLKRAADKGVRDRVRYLGPKTLEELVREVERCDLGIIPNPRNAFTEINTPTRIFEYLALGKPVIVPKTRGIQDYFADDLILYFEPGSSKDLASKMEYAFHHYNEVTDMAFRGQKVYLEHNWLQEKKTFLYLVTDLLNGA